MMPHDLAHAADALDHLAAGLPEREGRVRAVLKGPVAQIVIDHARAGNALTAAMMAELARVVARLQAWEGAAVVLRPAEAGAFCAGAHLAEVRTGLLDKEAARVMGQSMQVVLDAFRGLPQVSVAAITGPAVGGGAELATAADLRVIHPDAYVQFKHAALGVAPGWGGTRRLVEDVGRARALRWLTGAERLSPKRLKRAGFVAVVSEDVPDALRAVLVPLLSGSRAGIRAVKAQVAAGDDVAAALEAFVAAWGEADHVDALGLAAPATVSG